MKDVFSLKLKMDLDYLERKKIYDNQVEQLRLQRENFYAANPDFPIKTMYMNVCAPPVKFIIKIK